MPGYSNDERDLDRRLAMLERAEEIAGVGSWDWDLQAGVIHWSDNLFRIFGMAPGEVAPSLDYVLERIHADDRERVQRVVDAVPAQGRAESLEYRFVRGDGSTRWLLSCVGELGFVRGVAPRRLVGTVQDVTERRQIAREIAGHIALEDVIATWVSFDGGAARLLAVFGTAMGFDLGVLTLRHGAHLVPHARWSSDARDIGEIEAANRPVGSGPERALAVAAWLSATPIVVVDLVDAEQFLGRDAALDLGMRSAVALPAVAGERPLAVLEFYSEGTLEPTETLVHSLTVMGRKLGHFFKLHPGELRPHVLSPRERDVLELAAQGFSVKLIAARLAVSRSTVKTHLEHIYSKLGVSDRASAVAKGLREGSID